MFSKHSVSLSTVSLGREALIEVIRENDVTVLLGETGSGKTTRMLICLLPLQDLTP
jgi:HrpA-like RNA helicase